MHAGSRDGQFRKSWELKVCLGSLIYLPDVVWVLPEGCEFVDQLNPPEFWILVVLLSTPVVVAS